MKNNCPYIISSKPRRSLKRGPKPAFWSGVAITRGLRDEFLRRFPALATNVTFLRFYALLLNSIIVDRNTKEILIPCELLARIEGGKWHGRYIGRKLLDSFSNQVFKVHYSSWSYVNRECRRVTHIEMPMDLWELWIEDIVMQGERVDFVTGKPLDHFKTRKQRLAMVRAAAKWMNPQAVDVMNHMNQADSFFETVQERLGAATKAVSGDLNAQKHSHNILRRLGVYGQSVTGPSFNRRTVRLFDKLVGVGLLPKEIREILFAGCTEVDLVAAHFVINAYLWKLDDVQLWLRKVPDLWQHFFQYVDGSERRFDDIKAALKVIFYGVFYGKEIKAAVRQGRWELQQLGCRNDIFSHPIVKAIVRARDVELERIRNNRGATDIYGKVIKMTRTRNEKSILSQLAQAVELYLMHPIVEVAEQTQNFRCVLWLHDGCVLNFFRKKEESLRLIEQAVATRSHTLGMSIRLKIRDLGGINLPRPHSPSPKTPSTGELLAFTGNYSPQSSPVPEPLPIPSSSAGQSQARFIIDQNVTNYLGTFQEVKEYVNGSGCSPALNVLRDELGAKIATQTGKLRRLQSQLGEQNNPAELCASISRTNLRLENLEKRLAKVAKQSSREWFDEVTICVPNEYAAANLADRLGWNVEGEVNRASNRIKTYFELGVSRKATGYAHNESHFSEGKSGKKIKERQCKCWVFPFSPDPEVLGHLSEGWQDDVVVWILHDNLTLEGSHEVREKTSEASEAAIATAMYTSAPLPRFEWKRQNRKH